MVTPAGNTCRLFGLDEVFYGGQIIRRTTGSVLAVGGVPLNPPARPISRLFLDEEIRDRIALAEATGVPGAVDREIQAMKRLEAAALRVR